MLPPPTAAELEEEQESEEESEEESDEEDSDENDTKAMIANAKKKPNQRGDDDADQAGAKMKKPKTPESPRSLDGSVMSNDDEVVSPRAIEVGELFAKLALEKGLTPKTTKAAMKYASNILIPKECACGKKLVGQYVDLGACSTCTSGAKKGLVCEICAKRLVGSYKDGGLCATCVKTKIQTEERKQKLAEKEAAKKK